MIPKAISPSTHNKKFSISLRAMMALGFGGLVALSIALVLAMSVTINFSNTFSLLNSRAFSLIENMERSIRSQTDQAERTVRAVATLFAEGELNIGPLDNTQNQQRLTILKSLMITSPVVEALLLYDTNNNRTGIFKTPQGIFTAIPFGIGTPIEQVAPATINTPGKSRMIWGEPVVIDNILFHNVGFPLEKDGKVMGFAIAAIGQNNMNKIISELGRSNDTTAFVLTHDNKVIAHSRKSDFLEEKPAVHINDIPDRALNQFEDASQISHSNEHSSHRAPEMVLYESGRGLHGSGFVYVLRELKGYAAKPYRVGAYFAKTEIATELHRIMRSAIAGFAALLLAVIASFYFSRHLSKPMKEIAVVANDFSNLKLDNFTPLPASHIREIDDQAKAMNSMHVALGEFSHYVPRTLVKRLMASGVEATRSVEREITIMFADIVGYTSISEDLDASDTASLLNSHFDMLCSKIDRHNGTIDKFIGDGLMAFWGAPDADNNQAANALNAAHDILEVLKTLNLERTKKSLPPIRLRIGIHTGRVVVGNIGSCDRHNYTIVGDAVNVANRLEQYGKQYIGDGEAIILTSHTTWQKAGNPSSMHSIGMKKLRGRGALVEIYAMGDALTIDRVIDVQKSAG